MKRSATYHCPLCGRSFTTSRETCAKSCPLGRHCNLICCPHCGYSFPQGSRIYEFIKKLFGRSSAKGQQTGNKTNEETLP